MSETQTKVEMTLSDNDRDEMRKAIDQHIERARAFMDRGEFDMAEMGLQDAADKANIIGLIDEGKVKQAAKMAYYMDSSPRYSIPDCIYSRLRDIKF